MPKTKTYTALRKEIQKMVDNGIVSHLTTCATTLSKNLAQVVSHTSTYDAKTNTHTEKFFCSQCGCQTTLQHSRYAHANRFQCAVCGNKNVIRRPYTPTTSMLTLVDKTANGFVAMEYYVKAHFENEPDWYAHPPIAKVVPMELYLYDKDAGFTALPLSQRDGVKNRTPATPVKAVPIAACLVQKEAPEVATVSLTDNWDEMKTGLREWIKANTSQSNVSIHPEKNP